MFKHRPPCHQVQNYYAFNFFESDLLQANYGIILCMKDLTEEDRIQIALGVAFKCRGCKEVLPLEQMHKDSRYDYCAPCYDYGQYMDLHRLGKQGDDYEKEID